MLSCSPRYLFQQTVILVGPIHDEDRDRAVLNKKLIAFSIDWSSPSGFQTNMVYFASVCHLSLFEKAPNITKSDKNSL